MAICPCWSAVLALAVLGLNSFGQEYSACREYHQYHPWGEFEPGAWKLVRVVTETLDEDGLVTSASTTETRTTLLQMNDRGITLEVATTVEVAGKRFEPPPQTLDQGIWGQTETQTLRSGKASPARITIGERTVDCQVRELEIVGPRTRTTSKVFFSSDIRPHVLRRESVTTTLDGSEKLGETTIEVTALDLPFKVLSEIQPTAHVRSVNRHPKGVVFTVAVTSSEIPGGVVSHWSKEVDRAGRIVRRSTLELVDYSLEGGQVRTGVFGRPRPRRSLRPPTP